MKVFLVRHGQTNYNELGLCNDDPSVDVHLTSAGINQANKLAKDLKKINFEMIYVSELRRTKQTAEIINKYHSAPVTVDARLNDNRTGYEGKHLSDYRQAVDAASNKWTVRFNDGESLSEVKNRVADFIDYLNTVHYNPVLIVTSQVIVQAFYVVIKGLTDQEARDTRVDRGSCIEFEL